jgi:hypothetical protein
MIFISRDLHLSTLDGLFSKNYDVVVIVPKCVKTDSYGTLEL